VLEFWQVVYILIALAGIGVGWLLNVWLGLGVIWAGMIIFELICYTKRGARKEKARRKRLTS